MFVAHSLFAVLLLFVGVSLFWFVVGGLLLISFALAACCYVLLLLTVCILVGDTGTFFCIHQEDLILAGINILHRGYPGKKVWYGVKQSDANRVVDVMRRYDHCCLLTMSDLFAALILAHFCDAVTPKYTKTVIFRFLTC